jgi:hypothetical protein
MAYDQDFYKAYADYLVEPRVRIVHDRILQTVSASSAFRRIVDLGCGQGNEFFHHGRPDLYVGVDHNAAAADVAGFKTIAGDYRNPNDVAKLTSQFNLSAAVSLFSIECTAPASENRAYYEALFDSANVKAILAGGFYYEHAKGQETVGEAGGLISYQTHENIANPSDKFNEVRIAVPCPSTLFGEDVMEVWRLLQRKDSYDAELAARFAALSPNNAAIHFAR